MVAYSSESVNIAAIIHIMELVVVVVEVVEKEGYVNGGRVIILDRLISPSC